MRLFATIVSRGVQDAWLEKTIMPSHLKKLVHARMEKTGESYQTALRHVRSQAQLDSTAQSQTTSVMKYVHVDHGTPSGTIWRLSDDPDGGLMRIPVPAGTLTPKIAEDAFAHAVFPLIVETSDDEGETWVHHPDESPKRDWPGARGLLYTLLGMGSGRWNAGRIRARTGEELIRHPPKQLQEIADRVRVERPDADIILRPPMDQLMVCFKDRTFAVAPPMRTPAELPIYVTPVPPPTEDTGSWECSTIEEVLSAFGWPDVQPKMRIASVSEIRAK
jgi:hypothetical protein